MSRYIELPDAVYDSLQQLAEQEGTTPAEWIAEKLPALNTGPDRLKLAGQTGSRKQTPNKDATQDAWDVLDRLTGTVDAPEDWSTEHDHYITGAPKRQREA
jgi:hypothetical protein